MPSKIYHAPHTLIDKTEQELAALLEANEIDEGAIAMARWRKVMLNARTADPEIKRYWQSKEREKQTAAATQ